MEYTVVRRDVLINLGVSIWFKSPTIRIEYLVSMASSCEISKEVVSINLPFHVSKRSRKRGINMMIKPMYGSVLSRFGSQFEAVSL